MSHSDVQGVLIILLVDQKIEQDLKFRLNQNIYFASAALI